MNDEVEKVTAAEIKEGDMASKPQFYKNPAGVQTKQLSGGGSINDSILPIIKVIKQRWEPAAIDDTITIAHGLGKRCEFFGRIKSGDTWEMIPQFENTDAVGTFRGIELNGITDVDVTFAASGTAYTNAPYDIELYFIDFSP